MGFFFRKSFHLGPVNVNVSQSGVGFSFGLLGFRLGRHPSGRWYFSFFKWGFGYREELGDGKKRG